MRLYVFNLMVLSEILREDVATGATSAGAVAGFRGSLFGGAPSTRPKRRYKVRTLKYTNRKG